MSLPCGGSLRDLEAQCLGDPGELIDHILDGADGRGSLFLVSPLWTADELQGFQIHDHAVFAAQFPAGHGRDGRRGVRGLADAQLPVQRHHDVPAARPGPELNAIIHDRAPSGRTVPGGVWTRRLAIRPVT